MRNLLIEKLVLMFIFIVFYLIIEMVTFKWLGFALFPKAFLIDFLIVLTISSFALLFKSNRISITYLSILLIIISLISFANQTMNLELNGEIFTLTHLDFFDEAGDVFLIEFIHFDSLITLISIALVFGLTIYYVSKLFFHSHIHDQRYYKQALSFFSFIILAFASIFSLGVSYTNDFSSITNINLFKRETIKEYGLISFYYKDVDIRYFNGGIKNANRQEMVSDLIYQSSDDYNDGDLLFPYTSLLEGKNIITIMVESGQSFAINETLTPNLYQMTEEGLFFPNHYSENKTNVSEIIGMIGSYPSQGISASKYEYDFQYSLANILKDRGYHTAYFHENLGSFYDRENITTMLGFEDVYMHDDLFPDEKIYGWGGDYTLDSRTMNRMLDFMFHEDKPFYYFWTSLVGHGPYNTNYPSGRGQNNLQKFTDLGYFSLIDSAESRGEWVNLMDDSHNFKDPGRFRFYQATMIDFDRSIGILMDELDERDLIDDTIILIYGDHNLYYHKMHLRLNDVAEGDIHHTEMYKTMFMIYNPSLTNAYLANNQTDSTHIDKFISPYDIVPTYLQLLGIPHYKNFVLGKSIFSDEASIFYSHKISAFFNDDYFSYNNYSIYYPEDILVNDDLNAIDYLFEAKEFSEKLIWLDLWTELSKEEK